MTYKTIKKELSEILDTELRGLDETDVEDILERLAELSEILDTMNEDDEDDSEYEDLVEMIEEADHMINSEMSRESDFEEDDDDFY